MPANNFQDTLNYGLMSFEDYTTPTTTQLKQDRLHKRTIQKQNKLQPEVGILSSIYDADTYTMQGDPTSTRAIGVDAYESTKNEQWFDNPYNVARIKEQQTKLSTELGRPATVQDVFAAGDMQAKEAKSILSIPGLPALVKSTQINNLDPYDKSPQNNYGRNLGSIQTLGGMMTLEDGTEVDARKAIGVAPAQPASGGIVFKDVFGQEADEGRIGETIDMAQGALAKFGADTVNMLENLVGKDNVATYNKWAGELEEKLGGDGKAGWFIGEEERKTIESMRDMPTAQKEFGVSQETINKHNLAMKESEEMWVHAKTTADYIKSLGVAMSQLDRILAGSAGEIAGLGLGPLGPAAVAATRTSNFAEEYEKNNDKPMDKAKLAQTFFTELALLIPEKLLIKTGIGDIVNKTAGKSNIATRLGTAATGEGLQEYGEGISEEVATQKEGTRTVAEIATDPTTVHQAAVGIGMGAGTKATGETIGGVKGKLEELADKGAIKKAKATSKETTEEVIKEDTPEPTDIEIQTTKASFTKLKNKLDNQEIIGNEDMEELLAMEDVMSRYTDKDKKKNAEVLVTNLKKRMAESLGKQDLDENPLVFGSKAKAEDYIDTILEGAGKEPSDTIVKQLEKVAKANGYTDEEFKQVRDAWTVEREATISSKGYRTQGKVLRSLLGAPTPDKRKIDTVVNRMNKYKDSQVRYADVLSKKLNELETSINTYNKNPEYAEEPDSQYKIEIPQDATTSKFVININRNDDGTYKIDNSAYEILDKKYANIDGINKELSRSQKELKDKHNIFVDSDITNEGKIVVKGRGKSSSASRQDGKYYDNHNASKIITTEDSSKTGKWSPKSYGKHNADKINQAEYTPDDNVILSFPYEMKVKDVHRAFSDKANIVTKLVNKAVKAKATIILDRSTSQEVRTEIAKQLKSFGRDYSALVSETTGKATSFTFKPTEKATELNKEVKKKKKEAEVEKEDKRTQEETAALTYTKNPKAKLANYKKLVDKYYKGDMDKFKKHLNTVFTKRVNVVAGMMIARDKLIDEKLVGNAKEIDVLEDKLDVVDEYILKAAENKLVSEETAIKSTAELLTKYKKAKLVSDEEAEMVLASVDEGSAIQDIIDNSSSKGVKSVYVGENAKGAQIHKLKQVEDGAKLTEQIVDISSIAVVTSNNFINSIPVKEMGEVVSKYVGVFNKHLKKAIASQDTFLKTTGKWSKEAITRIRLADNLARGLLLDDKGNFNHNAMLAMKLSIDEFIAFNGKMLDSGYKSDADMAQMFGVDSTKVNNKMRKAFKDKGMLTKSMANSIGKAMLAKMGISVNKNIDITTFDKLAADLGNTAILAMIEEGTLATDTMSITEYSKALGIDTKTVDENATVKFIKFAGESTSEKVRETFEEIHELVADDSIFKKAPRTKPIKNSPRANKVAKTKAGLTTSPDAESLVEKLRAVSWRPDIDNIKRILDNTNLATMLGYTEDTSKMSAYDAEGQISINRDILKSIQELHELVEQFEENPDTELFFDWFYSSNGRYMMDANTINPQTDKLHRFLIQPSEALVELESVDGKIMYNGKDITTELDYAIAQAFGIAVDKKSSDTITTAAEVLKKKGTAKKIAEFLDAGVTEFEIDGIEFEAEHVSHAYQALDVLEKLEKGGKFTTSLTAETDAVTSGFALKLMQMPILEEMFKWLNKVGLFKLDDPNSALSMNDTLAKADFFDSYQTLAKEIDTSANKTKKELSKKRGKFNVYKVPFIPEVWDTLSGVLPEYNGKEVSSELRTLFKDPFMTFNYSAGMASIRESLSNVITNKVVTGMINAEPGTPEYDVLKMVAKQIGISRSPNALKTLQKELNEKPLYTFKVKGSKGVSLENFLNDYINASYGAEVERIMTTEFKPFLEAQKKINNAFQAMFAVFNKKYKEAVEAKRAKQGYITDQDKLDIIDTLRDKFPAIRGPLQGDSPDKSSYIGIYKTRNTTPGMDEDRLKPSQTYKHDGTTEVVRHEIKVFEEAISAGSVVPIHFIDAALMGAIINESNGNFTSIHDAIMMPMHQVLSSAKTYNKAYVETSMEYSFIEAIQEQLDTAFKDIDLKDKYYDTKHSTSTTNKPVTLRDVITNAKEGFPELSESVAAGRTELATEINKGVSVGHMASLKDGVYIHNGPEVKTETPSAETKEEEGTIPTDIEGFIQLAKEQLGKESTLLAGTKAIIKEAIKEVSATGSQYSTQLESILEECK